MIRPTGFRGAAFGRASHGDGRRDGDTRKQISRLLGIPTEWAYLRQVHSGDVVRAVAPGVLGEADALFTTERGLPMVVATADCFPIVMEGPGSAAVVHAGWRGVAAGVAANTRRALEEAGSPAQRAAIGPGIGPCCFEVGPEVAARFPGRTATTTGGSLSVDLRAALADQLNGLDVWRAAECTFCGDGYESYRREGTDRRQVALAWLP